jgi:hypothetical protein
MPPTHHGASEVGDGERTDQEQVRMSAIESSPERELYRPPRVMTKQEKLEEIRRMKAELRGDAQKESHRE